MTKRQFTGEVVTRDNSSTENTYLIQINTDLTIKVPSDFATINEALDYAGRFRVKNGACVIVLLESGYEIPAPVFVNKTNLAHVVIKAEDKVTFLSDDFDNAYNIFTYEDCIGPIISFYIDARNQARNGIELINASGRASVGAGIDNVNRDSHQTSVSSGSLYIISAVTSTDWSAIGGPSEAVEGDLFTANTTSSDISALGMVKNGDSEYGIEPNGCGVLCYNSDFTCDDYLYENIDMVEGLVVDAGSFVRGRHYKIEEAGTTDFTLLGAADNEVGTIFRCVVTDGTTGPKLDCGTGTGTAIEVFKGARFSGCAERGLAATNTSKIKANYVEVLNTGSNPLIDQGAFWASRGSIIHANHGNATGSYTAVRNGRSYCSLRDCFFQYINGRISRSFESGTTTASRANCDYSGRPEFSLLESGADDSQAQAGSVVNFERASFNGVYGEIAKVMATASVVTIDQATGTGIMSSVGSVDAGTLSCKSSVFVASADSYGEHGILAANGAEIEGVGFTFDANNAIPHIIRVTQNSKVNIRSGNLSNSIDEIIDMGDADGSVFFSNMTIDGVDGIVSEGVDVRPGVVFASRQQAIMVLSNMTSFKDGKTFKAEGLEYAFLSTSTVIPDKAGIVPIGTVYLEHFGAVGDGITDDLSAIQNAVNWMLNTGGKLTAKTDKTYLMSGTISGSGPVNFDRQGATFVSSTGEATFEFSAPNIDGPYDLTADYVVDTTEIEVSTLPSAPIRGQIIKIVSDAVDAGNRDEGSNSTQYRTAEFATVASGSTTTVIQLERPLRFIKGVSPTSTAGDEAEVDAYTTTLNARIVVCDMDTHFHIQGGKDEVASGAVSVDNLLRLAGYHRPVLDSIQVGSSNGSGVGCAGCTEPVFKNPIIDGPDQYGLALSGYRPQVLGLNGTNCRHVLSTTAPRLGADSSDVEGILRAGRVVGGVMRDLTTRGYFEEHSVDLHQGAEDWDMQGLMIEGVEKGLQLRGRNHRVSDVTIINADSGILVLTEYDSGDPDDDLYTARKTQEDFSSASFSNLDIQSDTQPIQVRAATARIGGQNRVRSKDQMLLYVNDGGEVHIDGHIDFKVTGAGSSISTVLFRVKDTVSAASGVFPNDGGTVYLNGTVIADCTEGNSGIDVFNIDPNSRVVVRGLLVVDMPSAASSFLNGGKMPEIEGEGRIIYKEAGVITEVYKSGPVTPDDFGAVGDNSTDDATPLTRWANFVDDIGEGEVGSKTYATSVELVFTSDNVSIRGRGDAAIRQTTWGYSGLQFNGDGCRVEGLKVYTTETRSALSTTFANRYEGYLARVRSSAFLIRGDGFTCVDCKSSGFVSDVRGLGQNIYRTGQNLASRTTTTTLVLDAADTQADDYWIGAVLDLQNISGTGGDTATRVVTDYENATNTVTFTPAYSGAPTGSDAAYRLTLARQKDMQITRLKNDGDVDFGIIAQWIDGLQATDCRWNTITQTQGDTPHALYLPGSPTNERSRNVSVVGFQVDSSETGLALKFRGVDGVTVSGIQVTSGRGICTFEQCTSAKISDASILELGADYAGSCWAVDLSGGTDIAVENVTATLASTYTGSDANTVEASDNAEDGPQQLLTDFRLTDVTLRSDIGTSNNGSLTVQAVRVEQSGALSPATQRGTIERAKAIETSGDAMTVRAVFAEGHASDLKIIDPYAEGTAGTINPTRVNATCANVFVKWDDIKNSGTNNITGTNNRAEIYA